MQVIRQQSSFRPSTVYHDKDLGIMNIRTRSAQAALVMSCMFWGVSAQAATEPPHAAHFVSTLTGTSEVPSVSTTGEGTLRVTLNTERTSLKWKLKFSGLTGPVTGAHFHGPAAAGANASVVIPLTGSITSPQSGEVKLTAAQVADLLAGNWYFNLHTAAHPDGEIRGQVMAKH